MKSQSGFRPLSAKAHCPYPLPTFPLTCAKAIKMWKLVCAIFISCQLLYWDDTWISRFTNTVGQCWVALTTQFQRQLPIVPWSDEILLLSSQIYYNRYNKIWARGYYSVCDLTQRVSLSQLQRSSWELCQMLRKWNHISEQNPLLAISPLNNVFKLDTEWLETLIRRWNVCSVIIPSNSNLKQSLSKDSSVILDKLKLHCGKWFNNMVETAFL